MCLYLPQCIIKIGTKPAQLLFVSWLQKREFTAQLLPIVSPDLPPKVMRPATKVVPFELEVDLRGAKKAEEWTFKVNPGYMICLGKS